MEESEKLVRETERGRAGVRNAFAFKIIIMTMPARHFPSIPNLFLNGRRQEGVGIIPENY